MRRKACALLLTAAVGGCMSTERPEMGPGCPGSWGRQQGPPLVPGVAGPHGQNLPMAAPYNLAPPGNPWAAQQMMANSVPLDMVQLNRGGNAPGMSGAPGGAMPFMPIPQGGMLSPPGVPFAPGVPAGPNVTPSSFMPGAMGDGVIPANVPPGADMSSGVMLAQLAGMAPPGAGGPARVSAQRTQIRFASPTGMKVAWFAQGPDGRPAFSNVPLEAPARYNFPQGAIYRLKISNIEGRPGLEVYPTLEVVPCNPKTEAFLAHSAVPLSFTQDDFKQIAEGSYVTKVIYLPDPNFQDVAGTGTDEIVSTRLDPGADPIQEALRRGSILAIVRMGNVDQEAPNTPPLGATGPPAPHSGPALTPGMPGPNFMVPYPGYMPHGGGVPHGGPGYGPNQPPPGFNPNVPPPGFNPNVPPPGFNPNVPPPPPSANSAPPNVLVPPGTSIFAPPAAPSKETNIDVPPPVAPTPSGTEKKIEAPAVPVPPSAAPLSNDAKKTPEISPVPLPLAPAAPVTNDAKTTPDIAPLPPVSVPMSNNTQKSDGALPPLPSVPPLPLAPGASDTKQIEVPPLPNFPSSRNDLPPLPTVTPASSTSQPMLPEVDGSPVTPAFPATPGTIRPAAPMSSTPAGSSRMPLPSDGAQAR